MDYSGLYYNKYVKSYIIFKLENGCYRVSNLKKGTSWIREDIAFIGAVSRELENGDLIPVNSPAIKIMFGINDES